MNRTYLKVPYAQSQHVKELGAKWDPNKQMWWFAFEAQAPLCVDEQNPSLQSFVYTNEAYRSDALAAERCSTFYTLAT